MAREGMKIKYKSRNHRHITNRMIADTFYNILKKYTLGYNRITVKTTAQLIIIQ